eukprot:g3921.t1
MGNDIGTIGATAKDIHKRAEKVWLKTRSKSIRDLPTQGSVFSWGGGVRGQLGTSQLKDSLVPQNIGGGPEEKETSARDVQLLLEQEIQMKKEEEQKMESEESGEDDDGTKKPDTPLSPQNVNTTAAWGRVKKAVEVKFDKPQNQFANPVVQVGAGDGWSIALTTDGEVYTWGTGRIGELGLGIAPNTVDSIRAVCAIAIRIPTLYNPGYRIVSVSAFYQHTLALSEAGVCFSWGSGKFGQLGHRSWENEIRPRPINLLKEETITMVAAGMFHSMALTMHGKVYSWGRGVNGQLGHGSRKTMNFPKPIDGLAPRHRDESEKKDGSKVSVSKVVAINAGAQHSLAIFSDGDLFSWGSNTHGQLGHGDIRFLEDSSGKKLADNGDLPTPVALRFFGKREPLSDDSGEDTEEEELTPEQQKIRDIFDELDADGSGSLDKSEVSQLAAKMGEKLTGPFGMGSGKLNKAFSEMDTDGSGVVSFEEFAHWWTINHPPENLSVEERVRMLFDDIDEDGSGELDKNEVRLLAEKMGEKMTSFLGGSKKLDEAFNEMDPNGDGTVTFDEFLEWYKRTHPADPEDFEAQIKYLFEQIDEDGSGELDKEEVAVMAAKMGEKLKGRFGSTKALDEAFAEMDPNGDGSVTFDEFKSWYFREHPMTQEHVEMKIKFVFDQIDEDGSGELDKEEVKQLCEKMGEKMTSFFKGAKALDHAFALMDPNNDGTVTFEEFRDWYMRAHPIIPADEVGKVKALFDQLDEDGSGELDIYECGKLMKALGADIGRRIGPGNKKLREAFQEMDPNGDGSVTFDEFLLYWKEKHPEAFGEEGDDLLNTLAAGEPLNPTFFGGSWNGEAPQLAPPLSVIQVVGGGAQTMCKTVDGRIWVWGSSMFGMLGLGSIDNLVAPSSPRKVKSGFTPTNSRSASPEKDNFGTVAEYDDEDEDMSSGEEGNVENYKGPREGDEGYENRWDVPKEIQTLSQAGIVHMSAGMNHVICCDWTGAVYTWGYAGVGALGHEQSAAVSAIPFKDVHEPRRVSTMVDHRVLSVAAGFNHSLCVAVPDTGPGTHPDDAVRIWKEKKRKAAKIAMEEKEDSTDEEDIPSDIDVENVSSSEEEIDEEQEKKAMEELQKNLYKEMLEHGGASEDLMEKAQAAFPEENEDEEKKAGL